MVDDNCRCVFYGRTILKFRHLVYDMEVLSAWDWAAVAVKAATDLEAINNNKEALSLYVNTRNTLVVRWRTNTSFYGLAFVVRITGAYAIYAAKSVVPRPNEIMAVRL